MKKIVILVCFFLIALAGCTPQPAGNKDVTTNANASAEKTTAAMPSESDIIAKEKAGWDVVKKKDWNAFGNMLASDYIEILDNGVHDKATALTNIKDFDLAEVNYSDWKMIPVDKDSAILTYSVTVKGKYKGEDIPPGPYRDSAAWVNRNGQWQAIYFQQTLGEKTPPPPPPAEKKSPAASPSTAMKHGEASSDVIANEKMVWDLFKARNFDAFAALLAPEFMEIESTGAYDKSGSVKGVQEMDASIFTLSDWKATKFDDDAALVSYTVTASGPKPEKDYHATIWANRNGKWMALLHQGTPAAKPK
jgi:hypothetical protein